MLILFLCKFCRSQQKKCNTVNTVFTHISHLSANKQSATRNPETVCYNASQTAGNKRLPLYGSSKPWFYSNLEHNEANNASQDQKQRKSISPDLCHTWADKSAWNREYSLCALGVSVFWDSYPHMPVTIIYSSDWLNTSAWFLFLLHAIYTCLFCPSTCFSACLYLGCFHHVCQIVSMSVGMISMTCHIPIKIFFFKSHLVTKSHCIVLYSITFLFTLYLRISLYMYFAGEMSYPWIRFLLWCHFSIGVTLIKCCDVIFL